MSFIRRCSRSGCTRAARTTLTYVYGESTAVLGPLATAAEPHSYDLCEAHSERLTVPRGWEVVRMPVSDESLEHTDDLVALADAVRESGSRRRAGRPGRPAAEGGRRPPAIEERGVVEVSRRGHLRVLRASDVEETTTPVQ